jgi:hypothetical protein
MPDLFHLSSDNLGGYVTLKPRLPRTPAVGEDTSVPRIAAASSVDDCLAGLTALKAHGRYHVYQLRGQARGLDADAPARLVPDWEQTREVWLLESNLFRKIGVIDVVSTSWDTRGFGKVEWRWVDEGNSESR